jgi:hypothetical protein
MHFRHDIDTAYGFRYPHSNVPIPLCFLEGLLYGLGGD